MDKPLQVIQARTNGFTGLDWQELKDSRELLLFLIWRDILIRQKQTILGALWEILKPLSIMMVLTLVMGYIVTIPSEGIPYPLFYYSGVLLWSFFSQTMNAASTSVVNQSNLITKVYFPRIVIPVGVVAAGLADLAIASLLLVPLMAYYGVWPTTRLWMFPFAVALATASSLAMGLLFSALIVKFRDFQNVLPVLTQLLLFLTPVFYPTTIVPEQWRLLYGLNPMAGAVQAIRWSLFETGSEPWTLLIPGVLTTVAIFLVGLAYFGRSSRGFVDWL